MPVEPKFPPLPPPDLALQLLMRLVTSTSDGPHVSHVEGALKWCRAPDSQSWKLIGATLRSHHGSGPDPWHGLLHLLEDLEAYDPDPQDPLHAVLLRSRALVEGATWDMPAILAVRTERILDAAPAAQAEAQQIQAGRGPRGGRGGRGRRSISRVPGNRERG